LLTTSNREIVLHGIKVFKMCLI